jgi:hypothetical protein
MILSHTVTMQVSVHGFAPFSPHGLTTPSARVACQRLSLSRIHSTGRGLTPYGQPASSVTPVASRCMMVPRSP